MGTNIGAFVTLNTNGRIPNRYIHGNISFFPLRGGRGKSTVDGKHTGWYLITPTGNDHSCHTLHKFGRFGRHRGLHFDMAGYFIGHFDLKQISQGLVYGFVIHFDDLFALVAVSFFNGFFDLGNGFFTG